jgi:hypothetical protein
MPMSQQRASDGREPNPFVRMTTDACSAVPPLSPRRLAILRARFLSTIRLSGEVGTTPEQHAHG